MLMTLLSMLGGGFGGLIRVLPEVLKFFADKNDADHEYRMTQLQVQLDQQRAQFQAQADQMRAEADFNAAQMQALAEAVKGQSIQTGIKWVDALSSSVRPILTYWWMILFTVYKISSLWYGWATSFSFSQFLDQLWTAQDWGIFSMIIGFWFVDRAFKRINGR